MSNTPAPGTVPPGPPVPKPPKPPVLPPSIRPSNAEQIRAAAAKLKKGEAK